MIWSPEEELQNTCKAVRDHCESLKPEGYVETIDIDIDNDEHPLQEIAPGVLRDLELHKNDVIKTDPYIPALQLKPPPPQYHMAAEVTTDEDHDEDKEDPDSNNDGDDPRDEDYTENDGRDANGDHKQQQVNESNGKKKRKDVEVLDLLGDSD
jgi:hypothetical protein